MSDTSIEIKNDDENEKECIICFDSSSKENILQPIKNFYIMPECSCNYDVHEKCIKEWQHIQQQQRNIYQSRRFYCLKCNSPVVVRTIWRRQEDDNVRRNNYNVVCVIISSVLGLVIIMLLISFIINP